MFLGSRKKLNDIKDNYSFEHSNLNLFLKRITREYGHSNRMAILNVKKVLKGEEIKADSELMISWKDV